MRRGDVVLVNFDPTIGTESNKLRPAVIVSNDAANAVATRQRRGVVTVVPVTTSVARVYPFQVLLEEGDGGLDRRSKAQAEQVRSVDVTRLGRPIGTLAAATMRRLDDAIRLHLAL